MYNYTYEGLQGYRHGTQKELIINSNKKEFKAFEWESIPSKTGIGLSTRIRMVSIQNKQLTTSNKWSEG